MAAFMRKGVLAVAVAAATLAAVPVATRGARAQSAPQTLTLRQALERAVAGNVDLRRQNVALRASAATVLAAEGQFDVVIGGDATLSHNVVPPLRLGDPTAGSTTSPTFNLGVSRALETGGKLSLNAQGRRLSSTSFFTCTGSAPATSMVVPVECNIYQPNVTLTFTQPLLRGFGREIAQANLRKARINQDLALLNRQAHAANDVRDTVLAYWELAYQAEDLEIRRSAEALARAQLSTTEAQIRVGRMGALEAAAVNRAIAQAQGEVAASEQQLTARALDLLRLLGAPVPRGFAGLRAADVPAATAHEVNVDAETEHALAASPALKSVRQGLALSELDLRVAAASMRPLLDFTGTVGKVGRNLGFGESLNQLGDLDNTTWSAGLTFALPVQNRAARGAREQARAAGESAHIDAEDLELAIRDSVARFAAQIRSAGARIDLARAAVGYAQQNLTAEQARFDVGRSTNNDVLLRQQELKQAQINVARAVVDLLEADVALDALTGDVLETYGVTLR
jgi:outer membrane protein TolC